MAIELASADISDCDDIGEDARGAVFPSQPDRAMTWSFPGFASSEVVGVAFNDPKFAVFIADSVSSARAEEILAQLTAEGNPATEQDWRWVAFRNIEVAAPAAWKLDYEAVRPDCIDAGNPTDFWARDLPQAPYVSVGTPNRAVPLVGCNRRPEPSDPRPAFGAVPFELGSPT